MMTDKRYCSLATVTNAGRDLASAGIITLRVGHSWVDGHQVKSTRYSLLPPAWPAAAPLA
jgi:hypothetical protein